MQLFLIISTWIEVLQYASHYYGHLQYYDENDKRQRLDVFYKLTKKSAEQLNKTDRDVTPYYRAGDITERYTSLEKLLRDAVKVARAEFGDNIFVFRSNARLCPEYLMYGPDPKFKAKINRIYKKYIAECDKEDWKMADKFRDEWDKLYLEC